MKLYVAVTTHNRPEDLKDLLFDLFIASPASCDTKVVVFDDGSDKSILPVLSPFIGSMDLTLFGYPYRHGKLGYTRLVSDVMLDARERDWDYFLHFQDDCRIQSDALLRWIRIFEAIDNPKKVCLSTRTENDFRQTRWGTKPGAQFRVADNDVVPTGWVDGCFGCNRLGMNLLNYQVPSPDAERWVNTPNASSGLGVHLTKAWAEYGVYQPVESISYQLTKTSVMQPEERKNNPQ